MIISLPTLESKTYHHFSEDISFNVEDLKNIPLFSSLNYAKSEVDVKYLEKIIEVKIHLKAELIMLSTRTLEKVNVPIEVEDTYLFSLVHDEDNEDIISIEGNEIDLYPYYLELLISSIPLKFVKDEDYYPSGDNWEVISEDEYNKRKVEDNPFSELLKEEEE